MLPRMGAGGVVTDNSLIAVDGKKGDAEAKEEGEDPFLLAQGELLFLAVEHVHQTTLVRLCPPMGQLAHETE
jgi:hypothetical protein